MLVSATGVPKLYFNPGTNSGIDSDLGGAVVFSSEQTKYAKLLLFAICMVVVHCSHCIICIAAVPYLLVANQMYTIFCILNTWR